MQPEITRLTKEGRWSKMSGLIDDEMLHALAVIGEPAAVGRQLVER